MNNVLVILFAVLDCKVWTVAQVTSWADEIIMQLGHPGPWLIELSVAGSLDASLGIIRKAMVNSGACLPDDVGDLMAGMILLRYHEGRLSAEDARVLLVDVVDAYEGSFIDAEAAREIRLDDAACLVVKEKAEEAVNYMTSRQLAERERRLLECL